jgi:starch synthase
VLPIIDFFPDIIHVNDWQSALLPVYLKTYSWNDKKYYDIRTVLTIHNILYQGRYGKEILGDILGFGDKDRGLILHQNDVNFIKAGMLCADRVITVSDSYSKEIQTFEGGAGLDDIARNVSYKLTGIVNGIDEVIDNPSLDKFIWHNYDVDSLENKYKNKEELQKYFGLEVNPNNPILSIVSRLVKAKGLDMVKDTLERIIATTDAQFVAVGEGEREYEDYFKYLSNKYPSKVKVSLGFSTEIGKKIYAGSDIYLMPSISEPCGISQMIASRYGTVPVVREVGGLKDTIKDFGCNQGGNGYTFSSVSSKDFEYSVRRAIEDYNNTKEWENKVKTVMSVDFSWRRSMNNYVKVYKEI